MNEKINLLIEKCKNDWDAYKKEYELSEVSIVSELRFDIIKMFLNSIPENIYNQIENVNFYITPDLKLELMLSFESLGLPYILLNIGKVKGNWFISQGISNYSFNIEEVDQFIEKFNNDIKIMLKSIINLKCPECTSNIKVTKKKYFKNSNEFIICINCNYSYCFIKDLPEEFKVEQESFNWNEIFQLKKIEILFKKWIQKQYQLNNNDHYKLLSGEKLKIELKNGVTILFNRKLLKDFFKEYGIKIGVESSKDENNKDLYTGFIEINNTYSGFGYSNDYKEMWNGVYMKAFRYLNTIS